MTPVCGHEYFGLIWGCMDWDDEYDNMEVASHRDESMSETGSERRTHPLDIANPASAYFFLSDDAQDEISGRGKKRMKCRSCGHRFMGEVYDRCPECHSVNTEETVGI